MTPAGPVDTEYLFRSLMQACRARGWAMSVKPLDGEGMQVWVTRQPGGMETPKDIWAGRTRYDALAVAWREVCKFSRDAATRRTRPE